MQTLRLHAVRSNNAFANLENQLMAMDKSGEMIAEATVALRASARIFAAATARLQASKQRRSHLRLVK